MKKKFLSNIDICVWVNNMVAFSKSTIFGVCIQDCIINCYHSDFVTPWVTFYVATWIMVVFVALMGGHNWYSRVIKYSIVAGLWLHL